MIVRRMLFQLAAVLACITCWGAECQTRAEAPEEYRNALDMSKRFWKGAKQKSVVVNWNPKAPGLAGLKMNVDIDVHKVHPLDRSPSSVSRLSSPIRAS